MAPGMPHPPVHAPFSIKLTMSHDWTPSSQSRFTGTADSVAVGTHVGTHIDSVYHIGCENLLHGGVRADGPSVHQLPDQGLTVDGHENFAPIVAPGVLLDFAGLLNVERCPEDFEIGAAEIDRCLAWSGSELRRGDVALVRTGWDRVWLEDPSRFIGAPMPGVNLGGARRLRAGGARAVGSDTFAFEKIPLPDGLAPHAELLVHGGIPIFECLNYTDLITHEERRFLFVCAPLRMRGATGSPVNPLALI
jgi:kynurenine formamidase